MTCKTCARPALMGATWDDDTCKKWQLSNFQGQRCGFKGCKEVPTWFCWDWSREECVANNTSSLVCRKHKLVLEVLGVNVGLDTGSKPNDS